MKTIGLIVLLALSAFAGKGLVFKGKITQSRYKSLVGRDCSIKLIESSDRLKGERKFYDAYPKIKGLNSFFNKRRATMRKISVSNWQDLDSNKDGDVVILEGIGSKYRMEVSQKISITMNEEENAILSWSYLDGTRSFYANTHVCK